MALKSNELVTLTADLDRGLSLPASWFTDPAIAAEYATAADGVSVWRNDPDGAHRLRLQLADVDPTAQAAVLGLDPIRDREEYAALSAILATSEKGRPLISGLDALLS